MQINPDLKSPFINLCSGETYEEKEIKLWLKLFGTDPRSGQPTTIEDLVSNDALKAELERKNTKPAPQKNSITFRNEGYQI